jgi:hypothetical protein
MDAHGMNIDDAERYLALTERDLQMSLTGDEEPQT